jgi:hypothetical protein
MIAISVKNEHGYTVGNIAKGEKLVLQYVSGKWKAWGKIATDSPDAKDGNIKCRLAICEANEEGTTVLAVVSGGTAIKPFEWIADKNYEKVVLRINDPDGDFESNPGTEVKYKLQVFKGNAL